MGLRRSNRRFGGMTLFCIARDAFNTPARPAVPSVCPMMVLTLPTCSTSFSSNCRSSPKKVLQIASASSGSPAGVPC